LCESGFLIPAVSYMVSYWAAEVLLFRAN